MKRLTEGYDEFGNPKGREYDFGGGDEDRVRGEKILFHAAAFLNGSLAEPQLRRVMTERGLHLDIQYGTPITAALLSGYSQLWFVSGNVQTLDPGQVQVISDYVRNGNGLAIWADNDPYFVDANLLTRALMGTYFSGNEEADRVMVPGPERTPGRFIEHPLTQGVNNLYEGVTICTIHPVPGITIIGQSHDNQLCVGCFEREGQRIVLDTGFTKLYDGYFEKSAGLGRYLSNIAFWLARGSRNVTYTLLTSGRDEIATISKGETSKNYQFTVKGPASVTHILQWDGKATLGLSVRSPDGKVVRRETSPTSPLRVAVLATTPGAWVSQIEGIDVTSAKIPYVLTLSQEDGTSAASSAPKTENQTVMPFYLLCDVSAASRDTIGELNAALRQIQKNLAGGSMDDILRLSVIAFNDTASTVVPLGAPSKITMPTMRASGGVSYDAALREYHRIFEQDADRLKKDGARVFRPAVFVLTQSEPKNNGHIKTLRSLLGYDPAGRVGNRAYPTIIPIGLGDATRRAVASLAYPDFGEPGKQGRWFLVDAKTSAADAYRSIVAAITRAITDAHASAVRDKPTFTAPSSIPGTSTGTAENDQGATRR